MQEQQLTNIHLRNKTVSLLIKDFGDAPVDTEELLQVDMNNLIGDIITFPVLFNRISTIKAEMEDLLRETQLDFDIFEAQLRNEYRKSLIVETVTIKGSKLEYPTEQEIKDAVSVDNRFKLRKMRLNNVKKEVDIVDGLYWSAKSKDKKLEVISAKIKPEDFEKEILEGTINSVMIRTYKV